MGLVGRILPWSRGWAGVPLSPTASASPVLVTSAGFAFPMLWYSTGPAGPVLALLPWTAEPPFSSHRSGGGGTGLLEAAWSCCCRKGPSTLAGGQSCAVLVRTAPGGMRPCSSLPGRAHGLRGLFHASSTSRGCRVSHAAQPGSSAWAGDGQVRDCSKGLVPLLASFPCSLHSPGSLEEQMNKKEGRDPSMGGMGPCNFRLSAVQLGW